MLSAVRLAYDAKVIVNTAPIQNWFNRLAEGLYNHQTPDGYAMKATAWNGPGQMMTRFEIARQIGSNSAGLFKLAGPDAAELPAFPLLQNALYFSALSHRLGTPRKRRLTRRFLRRTGTLCSCPLRSSCTEFCGRGDDHEVSSS